MLTLPQFALGAGPHPNMWIPHRVFFAHVAFLAAVTVGVLLLAGRPLGWRRGAEAVLGPPLVAGVFLGLTATRGMPLLWWERVGIGLWTASLMAGWLLGAAAAVWSVRRAGGSGFAQAGAGAAAAAVLFVITRALLSR